MRRAEKCFPLPNSSLEDDSWERRAELPRSAALLDACFAEMAEFLDARALARCGRAFRTFDLPEPRVRWLADQRRDRLINGLVRSLLERANLTGLVLGCIEANFCK